MKICGRLYWTGEDGEVALEQDFRELGPKCSGDWGSRIEYLDALRDWVNQLTKIYNDALADLDTKSNKH